MEFDLLNELLESSVSTIFSLSEQSQMPSIIQQKSTSAKPSPFKEEVEEILIAPQKEKEETTQLPTPISWVRSEGVQRLQASLKRLQIDNINGQNLQDLKLEQIVSIKKSVKNELKFYDQAFRKHFQRLPSRQEKEPMRPLYVYYKKIKQELQKKQNQAPQQASKSQSINKEEIQQKIQQLKQQKQELRIRLHNFQQDFTKTHSRKIRYHKDIQPVEDEYRKYKDIKLEIQKLEQMLLNNKI